MINYFNPNNTLNIINKIQKFVFALFIIVLLLGLVEALVLSPEDYKQSDSVRIMYVHVPSAWISLGIFSFISILSFGVFVFKNKNFSLIKFIFTTAYKKLKENRVNINDDQTYTPYPFIFSSSLIIIY